MIYTSQFRKDLHLRLVLWSRVTNNRILTTMFRYLYWKTRQKYQDNHFCSVLYLWLQLFMILIIIHYEFCYNSLRVHASQNIKDVMSKCVQLVIQSFQEAPLENLDWRNIACLWIWNHKHLLYIMFPNYISSVNLSTIRAPTSKADPLCPKADAFMVINRK